MTVELPAAPDHPALAAGFATLPVAALLARGDLIVSVNAAYEAFMRVSAGEVVGRSFSELIQKFVNAPDVPLVDGAAGAQLAGRMEDGHLWCRVLDGEGRPHSLRVVWQPTVDGEGLVIYLVGAEDDALAKSLAEALARGAGELVRCHDEAEVLERAADALHVLGFTVTILLLREGAPFLEYGPMRSVAAAEERYDRRVGSPLTAVRLRREILAEFNPDFHKRRALFFQNVDSLVDSAYPAEVAAKLKPTLSSRRCVQAPLFVDEAAYGAIVVTGGALTPTLAGSIEMFAGLVARAIENVRLHRRAAERLEDLVLLQDELVQRERLAALGEAAAVMAHEVRNPIGAILNAVALLRRGTPEKGDLLRVIAEEAARLERMVSDLLDLGRPLTPRVHSVDLALLAERSVAVLRSRRECEGIGLDIIAPEGPVLVAVDPDLAQLALLNVIRNAAQASPPGGRVRILVEARGERAAILVDDEGQGFAEEHAARLFEPFFTTRATGTGIGLAVVRRVVDASNGRIEVTRSPTGGGRLGIELPAATASSVPPSPSRQ